MGHYIWPILFYLRAILLIPTLMLSPPYPKTIWNKQPNWRNKKIQRKEKIDMKAPFEVLIQFVFDQKKNLGKPQKGEEKNHFLYAH